MAKSSRGQKEKIMIVILGFLILIIMAIFFKDFVLSKILKSSPQITGGPIAPPEISQPLPSISKIKEIINNPRLDEMQYYKPFSSPGTPGQPGSPGGEGGFSDSLPIWGTFEVGRPNPFIPFAPGE